MSEPVFPSQTQDKFVLRLPDGLRDRIKAAAEASGRSMNSEIVSLLEERYPAPVDGPLNLDALNMSEWLSYIDSAPNEAEFQRRLAEINSRLSASEKTSSLMVAVHEEEGQPRHLFVTRRETMRSLTQRQAELRAPRFHEDSTSHLIPIKEMTPPKRDPS